MEIYNIKEIYDKFNDVGCLSFATVGDAGEPETRIAHLRAFDDDGMYFMTMHTKSFYKQLKSTGKLSVCGLMANNVIGHDEQGLPTFAPGYAIRITGEVKEVSIEDIKAKNNPIFEMCIKDNEKYPAMVVFCITSARGDIFDYDFERQNRENKLERIYISYNGAKVKYSGLRIDPDKCIACGVCLDKCSFMAVVQTDGVYTIDKYRCDECGDCYISCPVSAIDLKH